MEIQPRIEIAPDGMTASIHVPRGMAPQLFNKECLLQYVRDAGVIVNKDVEQAVMAFVASGAKPGEDAQAVVAHGKSPSHGEPGAVQWSVAAPAANQEVSFYDRSPYITVKAGDVLGRVVPPTAGADGSDVRGRVIHAKAGAQPPQRLRDTLIVQPDGRIVAAVSGLLVRSSKEAWIGNVLEVPGDVDFSSGNVTFDGDVEVRGGVKDLFKVEATGNVSVDGPIGAAAITAGADLIVRYGAAGASTGILTVGNDLTARYMEAVNANVKGDARIERDVIDCDITVEGAFNSPGASVIGGRIVSAGPVTLRSVGSPSGARTRVVLGILEKQSGAVAANLKEIDAIAARARKMEEEQAQLTVRGRTLTPAQRERQTELQFELHEINSRRTALRAEIELAEGQIARSCRASLTVQQQIYDGVTIVIRGVEYQIRQTIKGPLTISDAEGQASISFGRGPARPLTTALRRAA